MSTSVIVAIIAVVAVCLALYSLRSAFSLPAEERLRRFGALATSVVLVWGLLVFARAVVVTATDDSFLADVSVWQLIAPGAVVGLALFELSPKAASLADATLDQVWRKKISPNDKEEPK